MDELVITLYTVPGLLKRRKRIHGRETVGSCFWRQKHPSKSSDQPLLPQASQTGNRQSISPLPAPILKLMGLLLFAVGSFPLEEVPLTMEHSYLLPRATWCFLAALRPRWDLLLHPSSFSRLSAHTLHYGLAICSLF